MTTSKKREVRKPAKKSRWEKVAYYIKESLIPAIAFKALKELVKEVLDGLY